MLLRYIKRNIFWSIFLIFCPRVVFTSSVYWRTTQQACLFWPRCISRPSQYPGSTASRTSVTTCSPCWATVLASTGGSHGSSSVLASWLSSSFSRWLTCQSSRLRSTMEPATRILLELTGPAEYLQHLPSLVFQLELCSPCSKQG